MITLVHGETPYPECDIWRTNALHLIAKERPYIVILSNYDRRVFLGSRAEGLHSSATALRAWSDGLLATMRAIQSSGARVVLLRDTPAPGFDVPVCLLEHLTEPDRCAFGFEAGASAMIAAEDIAARVAGGVSVLDLNSELCGPHKCPATKGGIPIYQDRHHLSVAFARSLAPQLEKGLDSLMRSRSPGGS